MFKEGTTLTPNINTQYCVTDKADGLRKLCFIANNGKIYLITTTMDVQFTGSLTKNAKLFNSIFDGEHILHDKHRAFINLYGCFDMYFLGGKDIRMHELIHPEKVKDPKNTYRLQLCMDAVSSINVQSVTTVTDKSSLFNMITKRFYVATDTEPIYKNIKVLFNQMGISTEEGDEEEGEVMDTRTSFDYITDGLIFTPIHLGVGINKSGESPPDYKKTWDYSFKWKPPEYNTIDFLISFKKSDTGDDLIGNIFKDGKHTKQTLTQYKTLLLKVGYDETKHGYLNPLDNLLNGTFTRETKDERSSNYKPALFFPTNPYDTTAHICNMMLKNDVTGTPQLFSLEDEIIEDNMIVEFKYDFTKENLWRWIPIKVRYDKTTEYRNGNKNYGNAYHVANSNWKSIHHPITPNMLCSSKPIDVEDIDDDTYYRTITGKSYTESLRDFHNLFVKRLLIHSVSRTGDNLIDYAVGKGGDFSKWRYSQLDFVLGIDLSRDNIEHKIDGACARYLNIYNKFRHIPKAMFLHGNSGLDIKNGSAFFNEKTGKVLNAIMGSGEKDKSKLGDGVYQLYGVAKDRFQISSIQFALHYMFDKDTTLHHFLKNISDYTKVGGFFIGTCFNGNALFNYIKHLKNGEENSLYAGDTKIWSVKKRYDHSHFADDHTSIGYPIEVFQETINKYTKEYLVNFTYLTELLKDYGFSPLTPEELSVRGLTSSIGSFKELYHLMENKQLKKTKHSSEYGKSDKMTDNEKTVSFLNNYFIFKKTQDVDTSEIMKMYVTSPDSDQTQKYKDIEFTIGVPRKQPDRISLHA